MCAGMTHSCRIRTFVLSHEDTETIRVVPSKSLPTPASMPFDSTSGTPDRMMRLLLKRKSEQIHLALLATVAAFACVYTLANYYTGNTNHMLATMSVLPSAGVAFFLHRIGYRITSKVWNVVHSLFYIALLQLMAPRETLIVVFFLPLFIGTLIIFQGRQRKIGYGLLLLSLAVFATLITTEYSIGELPALSSEALKLEWMLNIGGASLICILEIFFIVRINDLFQRRLVEQTQEMQESNRTLRATLDTRDKLLSVISHDLRSPISVLSLALDALADSSTSESQREIILNDIRKRTSSTLGLIDNLLLWARAQKGVLSYEEHRMALTELGEMADRHISLLPSEKKIEFIRDPAPTCNVNADRNMIDAIIRNLISNAFKFTPPGGTVRIRFAPNGNACRVVVSDTGKGLDPYEIERIRSGHAFTTKGTSKESGHGLGLQLVRGFLHAHNTELLIQSKPGTGSEFAFELQRINPN
jgi:signal transduction histidine kinase